ncbi:orotate phosphoribosyltransferase [Pleomorphovibrio marinus]|uniref:orotate phosphoribosyltransferase n=1 Tax=Pleomorphovibrio marinus TaxID=2164132 RepID=UPI000E0ADA51|nr:orotate phosphoribosyltransferase [Pleomorphovibrio marinus]
MEIFNENIAKTIASSLLEIEAIRLQPQSPFTWASGWKSPIYCDNRLSLSYPEIRSLIKQNLVKVVQRHFLNVEAIAGVATAGIPQGVLVAEELGLPFLYVRSKAKGHGMQNSIEGKVTPGQKVVVVEDLVSTGGSSLKAVEDLRNSGFEVLGMMAIFTYGFELAKKNFEEANVKLVCLSDYEIMLTVSGGVIKQEDMPALKEWRKAPDQWRK